MIITLFFFFLIEAIMDDQECKEGGVGNIRASGGGSTLVGSWGKAEEEDTASYRMVGSDTEELVVEVAL